MIGKLVVVALAFLSACAAGNVPKIRSDISPSFPSRIIGGQDADITNYPWQASLRRRNGHICGAIILSSEWLLTAAHCVSSTSSLTIRAGVTRRSDNSGQTLSVAQVISHEGYNSQTLVNDIALLRLSGALELTSSAARAIPLPPTTDEDVTGSICTITGWGYTDVWSDDDPSYPPAPEVLQAATRMRVLSFEECQPSWPGYVRETNICVDDNVQGACNGDSGGPLTCRRGGQDYVYGVTSFGVRGCQPNGYPSVYTRVTEYRNWILANSGIV